MPKYLLVLLFSLLFAQLIAQRGSVTAEARSFSVEQNRSATQRSLVPDTIFPAVFFDTCSNTVFVIEAEDGGFVAGSNAFLDEEKAQFMRFDPGQDFLITGVFAFFSVVDPEVADRVVSAKVYDLDPDTEGPGNLLATSTSIPLGDVNISDTEILGTVFEFPEPLLFSGTDFFVAIDFTDVYSVDSGDAALFSTRNGCGDGFNAWERWNDDSWHSMDDEAGWGLDVEFLMAAIVDTDLPSTTRQPILDLATRVFPNPASERADFTYTLPQRSEVSVELIDLQGRKLVQQSFGSLAAGPQSHTINLTALPLGLYTYRIVTEQGSASGRLVVK